MFDMSRPSLVRIAVTLPLRPQVYMRGVSDYRVEDRLCNFLRQGYVFVLFMQKFVENL
jgi:hypothetical protein